MPNIYGMEPTFTHPHCSKCLLIGKTELPGMDKVDWYLCRATPSEVLIGRYGNGPMEKWAMPVRDLAKVEKGGAFVKVGTFVLQRY